MKEGWEPRYMAMDFSVMKKIMQRKDADRLAFFDLFCMDAMNRDMDGYKPDYPDSFAGYAAAEAGETMRSVYAGLLKRVDANPSGKKPETGEPYGNPKGGLWEPNQNININLSSEDQYQDQSIINQLLREGYRNEEIQTVAKRAEGRTVKNWYAYLKTGIDQERKKGATPAQSYNQRDYSAEPAETPEQQLERLRDEMNGGGGE